MSNDTPVNPAGEEVQSIENVEDPLAPRGEDAQLEYGVFSELGLMYENWIDGSPKEDVPCEIKANTLTFGDLLCTVGNEPPPIEIYSDLVIMEIIPEGSYDEDGEYVIDARLVAVNVEQPANQVFLDWDPSVLPVVENPEEPRVRDFARYADLDKDATNRWELMLANGCIIVRDMFKPRILREHAHFSSHVLETAYSAYFGEVDTVERIIMCDINNSGTLRVMNRIFDDYNWPKLDAFYGGKTYWFPRGEPEYHAIMGTEVGRVVGNFVLGAFAPAGYVGYLQTTHVVSEIGAWWVPSFDFEDVGRHRNVRRLDLYLTFTIAPRPDWAKDDKMRDKNEPEVVKAADKRREQSLARKRKNDAQQQLELAGKESQKDTDTEMKDAPPTGSETHSRRRHVRTRTRSAEPFTEIETRLTRSMADAAPRIIFPPMLVPPQVRDTDRARHAPRTVRRPGTGPQPGFAAPSALERARARILAQGKAGEGREPPKRPTRSIGIQVGGGGAPGAYRAAAREATAKGKSPAEAKAAGRAASTAVMNLAAVLNKQESEPAEAKAAGAEASAAVMRLSAVLAPESETS